MESAHSNPPRRSSSGVARPRPAERVQSSSSTGSRKRTSRRDGSLSQDQRAHHEPAATQRSTEAYQNHKTSTRYSLEGELSEEPEEWERGTTLAGGKKKRKKKDEPMSPIAVVCYVVFFYVIWQILTRSDETEILSHLPLGHIQSLSSSHHSDLRSPPQSQYHLPYHLPQIPSPMPNTNDESVSAARTIFGIIMYPFYLLINVIAIPLPLLLDALYLLFRVIVAILYPITATLRVLGRTFILAPFSVVSSAVSVFYPLYVFIAGVIGVGCVLGLGVGWAGKFFLDILFGRKRSSARSKSTLGTRPPTAGSRSSQPASPSAAFRNKVLTPSSGEEREYIQTPKTGFRPMEEEAEDEDDVKYISERHIGGSMRNKSNYGGNREARVVGLRQRGSRGSTTLR